jgi:hypothetical protein
MKIKRKLALTLLGSIILLSGCSMDTTASDGLCPNGYWSKSIATPGKYYTYDTNAKLISADDSSTLYDSSFRQYQQMALYSTKKNEYISMFFTNSDSTAIDSIVNSNSTKYERTIDSIGIVSLVTSYSNGITVNVIEFRNAKLMMIDSIFENEYIIKTYYADSTNEYLRETNVFRQDTWERFIYEKNGELGYSSKLDVKDNEYISEVCN